MKKIIILLIILLLISGCIPSLPGIKLPGLPGKTPVGGKTGFIGGNKGMEAEILKPMEGEKISASQPFEIVVKVSNEGESEAKGHTCISGLNQKYFSGFSGCDCQEFELKGKELVEEERLEGEEEKLVFDIGSITPVEKATVTAKTRYSYKTYGIMKACIKKDAYSEEGCKVLNQNMITSASSAPLGIVEVKESIRAQEDTAELVFDIKMKESGKGNLYGLEASMDQCETPKDLKRKIAVRMLNVERLGSAYCGQAELNKEGEATAQCTIKNVKVSDESYEAPVTIELEYAYETIESNIFEVVS